MSAINIIILLAYVVISVFIARANKFLTKSFEHYAVGYASVSTPVLVCAILASALGAGSIIGNTSDFLLLGLPLVIIQVLKPISWWLSSKIFPQNLAALKIAGCLSISHVMYHTYGSKARWITTFLTLLTDIGVIAAQMLAVCFVLNKLLLIPAGAAMIIALLMVMLFSLMGGIRTIAQTGMFQFLLFFLLFPISYLLISYQYGGFESLNIIFSFKDWGFAHAQDQYGTLTLLAIFTLIPYCGSSFIQKCLIARNKKQLESSLKLVGYLYIPFMISLCLIAYSVKVTAPDTIPDQALFYYINNMCPLWMKGILAVSLVAIIMGMSDGILHADSVIIANDIAKVLRPQTSEKKLIIYAKLSIIVLSCAAFCLVAYNDVISMIWMMDSIWAPIILVPLCAAFAGFDTDRRTFKISAFIAAVTIICCYYMGLSAMAVLVVALFASFIAFFGVHIMLKRLANPSLSSNYAMIIKGFLIGFALNLRRKLMVLKARIAQDLFPEEEQMLLGQKLIYNKFCVAIAILFFVYAMLMGGGAYYEIMGLLLGAGYITATLFMIRDVVIRSNNNKVFYVLWYGLLIMWSTISGYALIGSGTLMTSIAALSLLTLIVFTNAITYLFSITLGLALSALIYALGMGGVVSSQFYLVAMICLLVGFFFLRPQEEIVKDRVAEQQMMLGTMAHELTSPQAAAEMSMEMVDTILKDGMRKKLKDGKISLTFDEESLNMLETFAANALKSTKAGIKVVKMLLMVSKTDKVELPKELFNMNKCAQKAIQDYTSANKAAIGKITVDVDNNWQVNGPKDFVEHVIHNLVKNSFVHGGKRSDLQVKVYNEDSNLIIEDNGVGIPSEYLPFIFDRFFTKSSSGTGIGLALSKMVAESMGGTIICESQIGEDSFTRFIISIPQISATMPFKD